VPHIFRTLRQFFLEQYEISKFKDLTAHKNYFGEKRSVMHAFFDFFATWFLVPSILCIPLVAYQYTTGNIDSKFCILFALFISVWSCILIEFWKRKEKQISLLWGIVSPDTEAQIVANPEFQGFNTFSWTTHRESKKRTNFEGHVFRVVNLAITLVLLASSVVLYIFFKLYVKNPLLQGIYLNAAVGVINYVFKTLTIYFVKWENHKYKQSYDNSLMIRLAVFKFINIHLPIVFALISQKLNPPELKQDAQA